MITFIEEDELVGLMLCFEPSSQYVAVSAIAVGSVEAIATSRHVRVKRLEGIARRNSHQPVSPADDL